MLPSFKVARPSMCSELDLAAKIKLVRTLTDSLVKSLRIKPKPLT